MNVIPEPSATPPRLEPWKDSFRRSARVIVGAWLWFFLVLFAYYCVKPLRDGLGTHFAAQMGNLYLATLLTTLASFFLYSQIVAWVPRRWLVLLLHQVFVAQLIWFHWQFRGHSDPPGWLIAVFFVWVSVFNLFAVTMFWSVMADLFSADDGKRWFGSMAAAGSVGSLAGSGVAWQISTGPWSYTLLVIAAMALEVAVAVAWWLDYGYCRRDLRGHESGKQSVESGTGGTLWSGFTAVLQSRYLLAICLFVALGKFGATFVYNFLQLLLHVDMPDPAARTQLFSQMNLWSQSGSMLAQGFVAAWMLRWLGVGWTLAIPGIVLLGLFLGINRSPTLFAMVCTQVAQQVLGYGILVPAQHVLFTTVTKEEKYKSKAFIDNVVFRGSDTASAKICDAMAAWGVTLAHAAAALVPLLAIWSGLGWWLGREQANRERQHPREAPLSKEVVRPSVGVSSR